MLAKKMKEAIEILEELNNDRTIPRNIKNMIVEVKVELNSNKDDAIKTDSALQIIDSVANDSNLPMYARTRIWRVVSVLESDE